MAQRIKISDDAIRELYVEQKLSMMQIAKLAGCSPTTIEDHLQKMNIERRNISEAVYARCNPNGDPFKFQMPMTAEDWKLFGFGLGLYWGEGTKRSPSAVRICNTDPRLLKGFMQFMDRFYGMGVETAKGHVQMFNDMDVEQTMSFWCDQLGMTETQFTKPLMTISNSMGTHNNKSKYGVATIQYHNTKLRNLLIGELADYAREFGEAQQLTIPREMVKYRAIAQKP